MRDLLRGGDKKLARSTVVELAVIRYESTASEGNSLWFYMYDIPTNTWTRLANAPNNFSDGGGVQYLDVGGASLLVCHVPPSVCVGGSVPPSGALHLLQRRHEFGEFADGEGVAFVPEAEQRFAVQSDPRDHCRGSTVEMTDTP